MVISRDEYLALREALNSQFTLTALARVTSDKDFDSGRLTFFVNWAACGDRTVEYARNFAWDLNWVTVVTENLNRLNLCVDDSLPGLGREGYQAVVRSYSALIESWAVMFNRKELQK